jgi:hypothetical protein
MKEQILTAMSAKYEADLLQARTTLEVYLTNPAGIGEHPGILEEIDKLVNDIATAQGNLDVITNILKNI